MKFVNYFANGSRPSALNLGVARVVFGLYAMWKFGTQVDWTVLTDWPARVSQFTLFLVPPESVLGFLAIEYWLTLLLLFLFTIGLRIGVTGLVASLFVTHMSGMLYTISNSGTSETFIPVSFILMIFAVYRTDDRLSIDHYHRLRPVGIVELTTRLEETTDRSYSLRPLTWTLVMVGVIYFLSGFSKVQSDPVRWATAENLNRFMQRAILRGYTDPLQQFIISNPVLGDVGAIASLAIELTFLPAILFGFGITAFVVGFFVFHTMIAVTLSPFFFDQYFALLLFFPWDDLHRRLSIPGSIDVVYDDYCHFCTRVLLVLDHFDTLDAVSYHPASDVPERLRGDDRDFENAMYAVTDHGAYRGYHAFRLLFSRLGFLRPLGLVMKLPVVSDLGVRLYAHIAANRSRYFHCSVEYDDGDGSE